MPEDYTQSQKEAARKHLLQSKIFKGAAIALAVTAMIVSFMLYSALANGDSLTFIKHPLVALAMLIPFLPAYVFAMMSKGHRSKATKVLEDKR